MLATRPWSFPASVLPVLVATASLSARFDGVSLLSADALLLVLMALFVHAAANLTNTLYDFLRRGDTRGHSDDRTLVDGVLSPFQVRVFAYVMYAAALAAAFPFLARAGGATGATVALGAFLAFSYTGEPLSLKYAALGDVVIFLCFGPLLCGAVSLALVGTVDARAIATPLPLALLTEGILHANNARDVEADARAGARTLAQVMSPRTRLAFFRALLVGAYAACLVIAAVQGPWLALPLLTVPLARPLETAFASGELAVVPQSVAQLCVAFGALLLVGTLLQGA